MTGMPALLTFALLVLLCRPALAAARPPGILFMTGGVGVASLFPQAGALAPLVVALSGSWLILTAAEPFDMRSLREMGWRRAPLLLALAVFFPSPEAARDKLARANHPDASTRALPRVAGVALGLGLLGTALLTPQLRLPGLMTTAAVGIACGLAAAGAIRVACSKDLISAVLVAFAPLAWGLAVRLQISPLAVLFIAGIILAHDTARREMTFTALREYQEPALFALLGASGALLINPGAWPTTLLPWIIAGGLVLSRLAFGRWLPGLAFCPLVLILPVAFGTGAAAMWAGPIAAAWLVGEVADVIRVVSLRPSPGSSSDSGFQSSPDF